MRSHHLRVGVRSSAGLNYFPAFLQIMQYFKLEIIVKPDGSVVEKVIAGSGSDCNKITEDLNKAIGITESETLLPEYFEQPGILATTDDNLFTTNY
ncbi:DUF2997 domain-containing protein [Microcoleus sp. herbarium14]|uniref:DUF2997 domain-containing protein n=1 Tax=Microcoleus sp. herbarium14 TaxID=3055439 RepID=UPI002FD0123A